MARKRVVAYVRVSSSSKAQIHSYEFQEQYWRGKFDGDPNNELVHIYADRGISGCSVYKRPEFMKMLQDARSGQFDTIHTKSVSRFARNTVELLEAVRELRDMGVEVIFEKEQISTMQSTSELFLTIAATIAENDLEVDSKRQKWSIQHRFENGWYSIGSSMYGFRMAANNTVVIVPEQAEVVRWIYDMYISGCGCLAIAKTLNKAGIPNGKGNPWRPNNILQLISNEKYMGDTLTQKTFTSGFPFVRQRNHGERDQYYTEDTHPAIITREVFEKTQELLRRKSSHRGLSCQPYLLSRKIICGVCGTPFARREGRSGRVVWTCRKHDKGASNCPMGRIPEHEIYAAFVRMYNRLKQNEGIVLRPMLEQLDDLRTALLRENPAMLAVNQAIAQAAEQSHNISKLQSAGLLDAEAGAAKQSAINAKLTQLRAERRRLLKSDDIEEAVETLRQMAEAVQQGPERLEGFDEELFSMLVDRIIVESRTRIRFRLWGGLELTELLEEVR